MAKLSLTANPTFPGKVEIPVSGGPSVEVGFTFKHRVREDFNAWVQSLDGKNLVDAVTECVAGWELDDKFTPENVKLLLENYMLAGQNIIDAYISELTKAKAKN